MTFTLWIGRPTPLNPKHWNLLKANINSYQEVQETPKPDELRRKKTHHQPRRRNINLSLASAKNELSVKFVVYRPWPVALITNKFLRGVMKNFQCRAHCKRQRWSAHAWRYFSLSSKEGIHRGHMGRVLSWSQTFNLPAASAMKISRVRSRENTKRALEIGQRLWSYPSKQLWSQNNTYVHQTQRLFSKTAPRQVAIWSNQAIFYFSKVRFKARKTRLVINWCRQRTQFLF